MMDLRSPSDILQIYVFSFNRGPFLKNCIQSLERCVSEYFVTIIDDNSNDPETVQVLKGLSKKYTVYQPDIGSAKSDFKTGGLSGNMNYAIDDAIARNRKYALFIQDDMQIVRTITDLDLENFDRYFSGNKKSVELHTCFLKSKYRESDDHHSEIDSSRTAYVRDEDAIGNIYFSDVGVFYPKRVKELFGEFIVSDGDLVSEEENEERAKGLGLYMGVYAWPFMHWLPFPSSHRGKVRNLSHRLMERLGGSGMHPFEYMSAGMVETLMARDLEVRPYGEDFLKSPTAPIVPFWSTQGGKSNTNRRGGWRRIAGRMISRFDHLLRGVRSGL